MGERTAGDSLFEAYAREWGYELSDHEPDLGRGKCPDYVLTRDGERCVIEVKQFSATTRAFPDQPAGSTDLATVLKPIRSQIREAARQLKDVADLGLPIVAVLTNPPHATVILGEREMVWATGDPPSPSRGDRAASDPDECSVRLDAVVSAEAPRILAPDERSSPPMRARRPLGTSSERGVGPGADDRNPRPMLARSGLRGGRLWVVRSDETVDRVQAVAVKQTGRRKRIVPSFLAC